MYQIYIIKSQGKNWYYVGMTENLEERLKSHNAGKTKSTKPYRPFEIVYIENYDSKSECRKRELFIKKNHAAKSALISQINMALSSNG